MYKSQGESQPIPKHEGTGKYNFKKYSQQKYKFCNHLKILETYCCPSTPEQKLEDKGPGGRRPAKQKL